METIKQRSIKKVLEFKKIFLYFDSSDLVSKCIIFGSNELGIFPSISPRTSGIFHIKTNLLAKTGPPIIPMITTSNCNKSTSVPK